MAAPVLWDQAKVRPDTFEGWSTFSKGLWPELFRSKQNFGQSVLTRNLVEADRSLDCPVAFTLWYPGWAERGTAIVVANDPVPSVVAVPTRLPSKVRITSSVGPNPEPVNSLFVVGGPTLGLSVMIGVL